LLPALVFGSWFSFLVLVSWILDLGSWILVLCSFFGSWFFLEPCTLYLCLVPCALFLILDFANQSTMLKKILLIISITCPTIIFSQQALAPLTVEKIMRDAKWMGTSPSNPYWSADGKYLLFNWNPEKAVSDSLYYITLSNHQPVKTTATFRNSVGRFGAVEFNTARSMMVYSDAGDIYLQDMKTGNKKKIIQTPELEVNPAFSFNDSRIVYTSGSNLFSWDINSGQLVQLTNFQSGAVTATPPPFGRGGRGGGPQGNSNPRSADSKNVQDEYLKEDALENSEVLRERKEKRELAD